MTAISQATTISRPRHYIWAGVIGNALEHYDTALFGLLAPFLAPLFFPTLNPINALILTYGMLPIGLLSRPIGSLIFGWIGDRFGRKQALSLSILGTACATGLMGCLPTYSQIGVYAPILLASGRLLQNLFAAGEYVGGAIFVLEHHEEKNKALIGSCYSCSTIAGILSASVLIAHLDTQLLISNWWRVCFWIGFATGLVGILLRLYCTESPQFSKSEKAGRSSIAKLIKTYLWQFLAIASVSGFSYAIFESIFVFMNGYLPKISSITTSQVMGMNTFLLLFDMALLPVFGWLSDKLSPTKNMLMAASLILAGCLPLFALYENATYNEVILIRSLFITAGVWFCAPFHAWSQQLIPVQHRYTLVSLGYAVGSQCIGAPMASIGFWLYHHTDDASSPALYLMLIGAITLSAILYNAKAPQRSGQ